MIENKLNTIENKSDEIIRLINVPYRHKKNTYEVVISLLVFLTVIANGVRVCFDI